MATRYSPEVQARAVRLVMEHEADYPCQWAAIQSIASKIGCTAETLRRWVRREERDAAQRADPSRLSDGAKRDAKLKPEIEWAWRRPFESAQYVSVKYTERLAEAGIKPSVGSVCNSYDNALAESVIGLFKTEVIPRKGGCRAVSTPSSSPPWNGSTGSIINAYSSRSETSRRLKPKHAIIPKPVSTPSPRDSHKIAFGKPGPVHSAESTHVQLLLSEYAKAICLMSGPMGQIEGFS